jgi:hypothetical protein
VGSASGALIARDAAVAIPDCSGPVVFSGRDHLRYLHRTLDVYSCVAPGPELRVVALDAETGAPVDRDALKKENRQMLPAGSAGDSVALRAAR